MPSAESRRQGFYYGSPRNRFFAVVAALLGRAVPKTADEKRAMLLGGGIALYDVLKSCDIRGSSDTSIRNAEPNDFSAIFREADIKQVFANGKTAHGYYVKYIGRAVCLPSTSPANAAWSRERLAKAWAVILEGLE
jgi:hypoxanthine-DNA glycosylase